VIAQIAGDQADLQAALGIARIAVQRPMRSQRRFELFGEAKVFGK